MVEAETYHDAPISKLQMEGKSLHIDVEEFSWAENEIEPPSHISIDNIKSITRNGVLIDQILPERDEGEIYRIKVDKDGIELIIIWDGRSPPRHDLVAYKIFGGVIKVSSAQES